jgi:hypothetical protein
LKYGAGDGSIFTEGAVVKLFPPVRGKRGAAARAGQGADRDFQLARVRYFQRWIDDAGVQKDAIVFVREPTKIFGDGDHLLDLSALDREKSKLTEAQRDAELERIQNNCAHTLAVFRSTDSAHPEESRLSKNIEVEEGAIDLGLTVAVKDKQGNLIGESPPLLPRNYYRVRQEIWEQGNVSNKLSHTNPSSHNAGDGKYWSFKSPSKLPQGLYTMKISVMKGRENGADEECLQKKYTILVKPPPVGPPESMEVIGG